MPSYNSYINAAGASTSVVEPNNDWSGFYKNNKRVPDEKLYAEGKAVNTYATAAPVVVRMPSREAAYNRTAQSMMLSSQNRIMEQQRQWNEAWAKRVAEMEQEEEPVVTMDVKPVNPDEIAVPDVLDSKLDDDAPKTEMTEPTETMDDTPMYENIVRPDALGSRLNDDAPKTEMKVEEKIENENPVIEEPTATEDVDEEDNFKANYPYEQIEVGLYGASAEMSDEEFLANVEAAENENIEEYAQPAVEEDVTMFNETQTFNNIEQDEFAEQGAVTFDDDDDDVISFDEPATVESVEVSFENSPVVDEDEEDEVPEPVAKETKKRGRPAGKTVSATKKKTTAKKTTTKKK